MDYEKKYKEALERANKIINDKNASSVWKGWLCNCFPELKESEDERIREEIISALKWANHKGVYDKHIAWLENLDEQKSFDYENANIQQKDFAPNDEEMRELLRTEYEKGRADVIGKTLEWINVFNDNNYIMQYSDSCEHPINEIIEWYKNYINKE